MTPDERERRDVTDVGAQLIEACWRQGSVHPLKASSLPYMSLQNGEFTATSAPAPADAYFVVTSQSCDLERDGQQEPFVEAIVAEWSKDEDLIRTAGGLSFRYFVLRTREGEGALIARAGHTLRIDKASLTASVPEFNLDDETASRFRVWLGARYARAALETELVVGVQRPIIDTIRRMQKRAAVKRVLDALREIRLLVIEPGVIDLTLIPRLDATIGSSDAAELMGAIDEAIRRKGVVDGVAWDVVDVDSLSTRDYLSSVQLPLDHFTPHEDVDEE